ncbi:hypothetical protein E4680_11760, partial [Candidatus Macondimonas diazotrophica]
MKAGDLIKHLSDLPGDTEVLLGNRDMSGSRDQFLDILVEHNKAVIDKDVEKLIARIPQYMGIVFPADGVGTGLSRLDVEAPETY